MAGQNGRVEFHFDVKRDAKPTILEDGRVDFRELNLIECVTEGQQLCTLVPAENGTPGKTVFGTLDSCDKWKTGNSSKSGRNVTVSEDGMQSGFKYQWPGQLY